MFKSVRTDRVSQAIVDQIKKAIFQKKIKIGDKLPSERQMMEGFEASRVTVREALKTLEQSGLVEIKRGTQGGAFVRDPGIKPVRNFLQDMFSMGSIKGSDLTEARLAMEPFLVKVAIIRISEDAKGQLGQNIIETKECLQSNNLSDARLLNLEFHRIISHACENPVMSFMIDSIMDVMESVIPAIPIATGTIESTLHFHEEIYEAIKNHEHEKAQDIMGRHLQDVQGALAYGQEVEKSQKKK